MMTRRTLIRAMALAGLWPVLARASEPERASTNPDENVESLVSAFMKTYNVPALSLAFARPHELLFRQAWGVTQWGGDAVTTEHLFRIASATKPITAVAIFLLVERGFLQLDDAVFGDDGLLKDEFGADLPTELNKITVRHLLMHTAGGWANDGRDPTIWRPDLSQREWLELVLQRRPLQWEPGTHYAYSNVGYCLLGAIISRLTAQSYAEFVEEKLFAPCNIKEMRLATDESSPGEVRYYEPGGTDPYARNMARLEACAGWLATPTDLVRFAAKFPTLLQASTIETMTTPGPLNPNYACGWMVNSQRTLWHSGGIAGTNSFVVRTSGELCWAVLINTSNRQSLKALNQLMWDIVRAVGTWKV